MLARVTAWALGKAADVKTWLAMGTIDTGRLWTITGFVVFDVIAAGVLWLLPGMTFATALALMAAFTANAVYHDTIHGRGRA